MRKPPLFSLNAISETIPALRATMGDGAPIGLRGLRDMWRSEALAPDSAAPHPEPGTAFSTGGFSGGDMVLQTEFDGTLLHGLNTENGLRVEIAAELSDAPARCLPAPGTNVTRRLRGDRCVLRRWKLAKILSVVHTERGERIRIISARHATAFEWRNMSQSLKQERRCLANVNPKART